MDDEGIKQDTSDHPVFEPVPLVSTAPHNQPRELYNLTPNIHTTGLVDEDLMEVPTSGWNHEIEFSQSDGSDDEYFVDVAAPYSD